MSLFRPLVFDHSLLPPFGLFDEHTSSNNNDENGTDSTAATRRNAGHDAHLSVLNTLWPNGTRSSLSNYLSPKIDLHEEGDKYKLSAELAGVPKENIKLNVDDRTRRITISGELRSEYGSTGEDEDKKKKNNHSRPLISERVYGSFTRSIVLPETVDLANLKASFKDGVLGVTIPKKAAEVAKNRSVTISDGDDE